MQIIHSNDCFAMTGSPTAYIKEENEDYSFNPHHYRPAGNQYGINHPFTHFGSSAAGDMSGVNPSELTVGNMTFGNQMSGSFIGGGNSGIDDDELLALGNLDDNHQQYAMQGFQANHQQQGYVPNGAHQMYSHTPSNDPIISPMNHNRTFDFSQYGSQQQMMAMTGGRRSLGMERHPSDSRSPMTPTTPASRMQAFGTPDSNNLQYQAHLNHHLNHQAKMQSASWDRSGNSGSAGSGWDSPLASPQGNHFNHGQIAEIMHAGKAGSLPAKVENGMHPTFQSQEAKKKRRRESHNAVERRRRDNINERIHDLSKLVPAHRLEDEKVRKHLTNNGALSPTLGATGMSPPAATSLLAGGQGRRAAGTITQGLPIEEKDKGPNKGDILNGSVSWTRDLMWKLYESYKEQEQLRTFIESHGLQWPLSENEDQKRMKSELITAVEKNGKDNFTYSRGAGSGLRVPGYTGVDGSALNGTNGCQQGLGTPNSGQNFNGWLGSDSSHQDSFSLKEEDENSFGMDMG